MRLVSSQGHAQPSSERLCIALIRDDKFSGFRCHSMLLLSLATPRLRAASSVFTGIRRVGVFGIGPASILLLTRHPLDRLR